MHLPQYVAWYLICFGIGSMLGLIPVRVVEVLENTDDSLSATIVAIGREMNWIAVVSGAYSFAGVEGFTMLAEIFIKRREEKAREEQRQQIASRFENKTPEEQVEEAKRLIAEARDARRRSG